MTPLEIDIILHYGTRGADYRDGDFSAPAVRQAIDYFCNQARLIEPSMNKDVTYQLTERGEVYMQALLDVPLPIQVWKMP